MKFLGRTFSLESLTLILVLLAGAGLFALPQWHWENGRFDSTLDGAISVPIFVTAIFLLMARKPDQQTTHLALAFLVTGVLRLIDSAVDTEKEIVWLHRLCSLSLGIVLLIEWLPIMNVRSKTRVIVFFLGIFLAFGLLVGFLPDYAPAASDDHWTCYWLNIMSYTAAAIFFLAALVWWIRFGRSKAATPQLFICSMFLGMTAALYSWFPIWSLQWWMFQVIELGSNCYLALTFFNKHNQDMITNERNSSRAQLMENVLAFVSHDIRNPLSSVRLATEVLLRRSNPSPDSKKTLKRILRNVDQVDSMTQSLLDAELLRRGGSLPLRFSQCDLSAEVRKIIDEMNLPEANRVTFEAPEPLQGFWSVEGILRAVQNLVTNAIRYGTLGKAITVRLRRINDKAELSVHNWGTEIPKERHRKLFEAFHRDGHSSGRGWGLGLTLVRGIAEAHGGEVSIVSSKVDGTTFTLILPIVEDLNSSEYESAGNSQTDRQRP